MNQAVNSDMNVLYSDDFFFFSPSLFLSFFPDLFDFVALVLLVALTADFFAATDFCAFPFLGASSSDSSDCE